MIIGHTRNKIFDVENACLRRLFQVQNRRRKRSALNFVIGHREGRSQWDLSAVH